MSFFVDLTLSDDEAPRAPRRPSSGTAGPAAPRPMSPDSDVVILDDAPRRTEREKAAADRGQDDLGDDDLQITGVAGIDSRRDLPHTRDQCGRHGFSKATSSGNQQFCDQAGSCEFWGSGARETDHCNAHHTPAWDTLRAASRSGNKDHVRRCYLKDRMPAVEVATLAEGDGRGSGRTGGSGSGGGRSIGGLPAAVAGIRQPQQRAQPAALPRPTGAAAAPWAGAGPLPRPTPLPSPWQTAAQRKKEQKKHKKERKLEQQRLTALVRSPPATAGAAVGAAAGGGVGQGGWRRASSVLKPLPDPALDPDLVHVGQLRLPIKTTKKLTVSQLQERLAPFGYFMAQGGRDHKADDYRDQVCIDNLTDTSYSHEKGKVVPNTLQLLPLEAPEDEMKEPDRSRVRPVTVVHYDGLEAPITIGVTVDREARAEVLVAEVKAWLGDKMKPGDTLRLCQEDTGSSYRGDGPGYKFIDLQEGKSPHMTDSMFTDSTRFFVFRVPQPPAGVIPAEHQAAYSSSVAPEYVLLLCERSKEQKPPRPAPAAAARGDDDCCGAKCGGGADASDPEDRTLARIQHLRRIIASDSEPDSDDSGIMMGLFGPPPPRNERFGTPLLVPFPCGLATKGIEAERAGRAALETALRPFFPPGAPTGMPFLRLYDGTCLNTYSEGGELSTVLGRNEGYGSYSRARALQSRFNSLPRFTSTGRVVNGGVPPAPTAAHIEARRGGVGGVYVQFGSHAPPATFDVAAFCTPRVDASATPEALAPTQELMKQEATYRMRMKLLSDLPANVISELKRANRRSPPPPLGPPQLQAARAVTRCHAATRLTLKPSEGEGADPRKGTLLVDVYVWRPNVLGGGRTPILADYDAWSIAHTHRGRSLGDDRCPLQSTLDLLALQSGPRGYAMLQRLQTLMRKESGAASLKGLMEAIVADERPAAPQPVGLAVTLHPYQRQSLQFMLDCERKEGGFRGHFWVRLAGEGDNAVWYSPIFHRASLAVPEMPTGGFLCEEMGLGKTIEVLSLILAAPPSPSIVSGRILPSGLIETRATLVVCAVSLVGQWCTEAEAKLQGSLRMHQYHGQNRCKDPRKLAMFDLVVTTYETLASDNSGRGIKGGGAPCNKIKWHRVVFDEGHKVKAPTTAMAKACVELEADRRWVCTGTPINNSIDDLLGQFGVLKMKPLCVKTFFDGQIKPAYASGSCYDLDRPVVKLLAVLDATLIRHTKRQRISGTAVLELPPKTEEAVPVPLTSAERALYLDTHAHASRLWHSVRGMSPAYINKRLLQIMSLLNPLRRICSGGRLIAADLRLPEHLEEEVAPLSTIPGAAILSAATVVREDASLVMPTEAECSICLDTFETPVVTPCNHWFCRECILSVLATNRHCPLCRGTVDETNLRAPTAEAVAAARGGAGGSGGGGGGAGGSGSGDGAGGSGGEGSGPAEPVPCESKLRALLRELRAMRRADPSSKALVFSQYASTLEWLQQRLPQEGLSYRTITGSMGMKQRAKAIEAFQRDPPTTVFLLSMRSGAVGINLTAANHVFLLEPCLNPALEAQAIGRAWRMGQQRPVVVKKFYVKGSIEERIMEVRRKRQEARTGQQPAGAAAAAAAAGGASTSAAPAAGAAGTSAAAGAAPDAAAGAAGTAAAGAAAGGTATAGGAGAGGSAGGQAGPSNAAPLDEEEEMGGGEVTTIGGRPTKVKAGMMAGSLRADRQVLKVAELDLLFQEPKLDKAEDHPELQLQDEADADEAATELAAADSAGAGGGAAAATPAARGRGRGRGSRGGGRGGTPGSGGRGRGRGRGSRAGSVPLDSDGEEDLSMEDGPDTEVTEEEELREERQRRQRERSATIDDEGEEDEEGEGTGRRRTKRRRVASSRYGSEFAVGFEAAAAAEAAAAMTAAAKPAAPRRSRTPASAGSAPLPPPATPAVADDSAPVAMEEDGGGSGPGGPEGPVTDPSGQARGSAEPEARSEEETEGGEDAGGQRRRRRRTADEEDSDFDPYAEVDD